MNIRGQIDQVVTSVIVLFAVVFLMLIFTYATAVLNLFSSGDGFVMHNNEPRDIAVYSAFLDLFLSDRVYTEGAYLGVREAIAAMTSEGNEKAAFAVEQLFRQHYACDSDSFFVLGEYKGESSRAENSDGSFDTVQVYAILPSRGFDFSAITKNVGALTAEGVLAGEGVSARGTAFRLEGNLFFVARGERLC
ncbi:MAG: hypothetical protein AABX12_04310 [Nanoarchaeota archaeon]